MKAAPLPENEAARVRALREYAVLDTPPEPAFDDITALAAHSCKRPFALLSLVDADRQWFKSTRGIGMPICNATSPLPCNLGGISDSLADTVVQQQARLPIKGKPTLADVNDD